MQKHPVENYGDGVSSNDDTNSTVNPLQSISKDDVVHIILGIVICVCVSYSSFNTLIYFDLTLELMYWCRYNINALNRPNLSFFFFLMNKNREWAPRSS
jgi:hypothetical protein